MTKRAILALADGSIFHGETIGVDGKAVGEVVFNTSMTGYEEILTDPSYAKQIITLTYPHIGNTGITIEDAESKRIWAVGLIIRNLPLIASSWRYKHTLSEYLKSNNTIAIADIDTRRLTRILRDKGSQNGCIIVSEDATEDIAINNARLFSGLQGLDLAKEVTTKKNFSWRYTLWKLGEKENIEIVPDNLPYHVVIYDFGVKFNMLRMLVARGCKLTVVSAYTKASEVVALNPDGIFLSNGPGDPAACKYAIKSISELLEETNIPIFGICLGHQLLALASGAKTIKMKHGHHGVNHPVQDIKTGSVMITSQNHGFSIDKNSLPKTLRATHKSLLDGTVQGIERTDTIAFSFQGHPEAHPGPHDLFSMFDKFINVMDTIKNKIVK